MFSSIYYGCKLEQESKNYIYEMQKERYKVFKSQDSTNEQFDVIFEIEGKKIYASKYVLISVSEYMNAFLSDRWLKKDEVIKIETYSYDSFYQFLCFLYSGHCHLTTQNVYELTDMAESYAVSCLKSGILIVVQSTEMENDRNKKSALAFFKMKKLHKYPYIYKYKKTGICIKFILLFFIQKMNERNSINEKSIAFCFLLSSFKLRLLFCEA